MTHIFIINGYGVPKDIMTDTSYHRYLSVVFNTIFEICRHKKEATPLIVFSGGRTDMFLPYKRTEAGEMKKYFMSLAKRSFVKDEVKNWQYITETKALSSLENIVFAKEHIQRQQIKKGNVFVFCEYTRENRIKKIAQQVFNDTWKLQILPVDFDLSFHRYELSEKIKERESTVLKHDLCSLKSEKNMKSHHKLYTEKIKFLRERGPDMHQEAIKEWWEGKLREMKDDV